MALATTCPQCMTSFRVVPDQLKLRRGLVRCGTCQHVFSGIDYLRYVDDSRVRASGQVDDEPLDVDAIAATALLAPDTILAGRDPDMPQEGEGATAALADDAVETPVPHDEAENAVADDEAENPVADDAVENPVADDAVDSPVTDAKPASAEDAVEAAANDAVEAAADAAGAVNDAVEAEVDDAIAVSADGTVDASENDAAGGPADVAVQTSANDEHEVPADGASEESLEGDSDSRFESDVDLRSAHATDLRRDDDEGLLLEGDAGFRLEGGDGLRSEDGDELRGDELRGDELRADELRVVEAWEDSGRIDAAPDGAAEVGTGTGTEAGTGADADADADAALSTTDYDIEWVTVAPISHDADEAARENADAQDLATAPQAAGADRDVREADSDESAIDYFSTRQRGVGFVDRHGVLTVFVAGVLVLLLAVQWAVIERSAIAARLPAIAPAFAAVLAPFGLRIDPPRDLESLTIEAFELHAAATPDLLEMSALLRNRAQYAVRWPSMQLTLTDPANRVLVRKVIGPEDYLGAAAQNSDDGVPPRGEWPLHMALEARDLRPAGYNVLLFYP